MKKSLWKIWTDLDLKVGCIKKDRRLFELSESLNVLSDNNFHLKNCMNIQFHWYNHLKYQFVCKYMEKITMENLDWFWIELDEKVGCIKEKIDEFLN